MSRSYAKDQIRLDLMASFVFNASDATAEFGSQIAPSEGIDECLVRVLEWPNAGKTTVCLVESHLSSPLICILMRLLKVRSQPRRLRSTRQC